MTVIEKSPLLGFLEGLSQQDWLRALDELGSAIHPVDREATRIWFAFWPLDLHTALSESKDPQEIARLMDLEGNWRLEEQMDASVSFLYGAHFWPRVKKAVLEERSQVDWLRALDEIGPAIHPVDREATRIWFAFWPLELRKALSESPDAAEIARLMDLEGNWRLEEQIDSSVSFLYGAHHWASVKNTVLAEADATSGSLPATIRSVAQKAGAAERVDPSLVLGIAAVGLMMFRQVGLEAFERSKD
ncbi:MAG TPA: hypothetical protein VIG29_03400, partial [Vicinamibacteria bacterium]